jgi:hypothetical protein
MEALMKKNLQLTQENQYLSVQNLTVKSCGSDAEVTGHPFVGDDEDE